MKIWDFPMEQPKVESRSLKGIHLDIDYNGGNGLCEVCHHYDATHIFNIGPTMHHLCGDCFNVMMEQFTNAAE